jgi:hypothetical protein
MLVDSERSINALPISHCSAPAESAEKVLTRHALIAGAVALASGTGGAKKQPDPVHRVRSVPRLGVP